MISAALVSLLVTIFYGLLQTTPPARREIGLKAGWTWASSGHLRSSPKENFALGRLK
jgi:hypothetical protein